MKNIQFRNITLISFVFLVITISGFLVFSWLMNIETDKPSISIKNEVDKPVIYFGVIARYSPRKIYQGYQPFMDYLTHNSPYQYELILSRDYNETVEKLIKGEVDFASLGNYTYINAKKKHDIKCIAKPYNMNGELAFYDNIVVRDTCQFRDITDFIGKNFAFASEQSFSFWLTKAILLDKGMKLSDLGKYQNFKHHDIVAEKVIKGEYDIGMIKGLAAKKYIDKGLKIIYTSDPIPGVPIVAAPHIDMQKYTITQNLLLAIKSDIDSGKLLTNDWDKEISNGFTTAQDSDYDYSRKIIERAQSE
jgi:phosphonate transport system substrate-binding protein